MRPLPVGLIAIAALAALAAQGAAAGRAASACSSGQVVKTPKYVFALSIGPMETMYTPAQARAKHPGSGEIMLSGQMTGGMAGMTMDTSGLRHLELHICTPAGTVVTNAHPKIVVSDPVSKTMAVAVPVAKMQGVKEGASDIHYGNNVTLDEGHKVTVTVSLDGQTAVFHTTVPRSSM
jgi:hypothetical protein